MHHQRGPVSSCLALSALLLSTGGPGCKKRSNESNKPHSSDVNADPAAPHLKPHPQDQLRGERIVAIGDVHGDLAATKRALTLAGLIDAQGNWSGGATILVQTGDILDRGDDEPEILALFWRLQAQAPQSGGRVELLLGNHEIMNAQGDLRYVTPDGFLDYAKTRVPPQWPTVDEAAAGLPAGYVGRKAAFVPGSEIALRFAKQNIATVVGDTVFVHGGISLEHAKLGIAAINAQTQAWLTGAKELPEALKGAKGPIWNRDYSQNPDAQDCEALSQVLSTLGVSRMVVGHTVQPNGIRSACDGKVWCIDVGMASHYGGQAQALEIVGSRVRVLQGAS